MTLPIYANLISNTHVRKRVCLLPTEEVHHCHGKWTKQISLGSVVASALRKRVSMVAGVGRALSARAIVEPANSPKSRACIGSLIPCCKDGIGNLDTAGMLRLFNGDRDSTSILHQYYINTACLLPLLHQYNMHLSILLHTTQYYSILLNMSQSNTTSILQNIFHYYKLAS